MPRTGWCVVTDFFDAPDTWSYPTPPARNSSHGLSSLRCGCVLPAACEDCDGTRAERDELWRLPRRDRVAAEVANRRLDPAWRELHGLDESQDGAA